VRLLDLIEAAGTVFAGVEPAIGGCADKGARRFIAAVELDPVHDDDFVNDGADLARDLCAFHLHLKAERAVEVVGQLLKDGDEDDMFFAHMLQLMQPEQKLARMQPVGRAGIL
jgi:hypothetical protein